MSLSLFDFTSVPPIHNIEQKRSLDWLMQAYAQASATLRKNSSETVVFAEEKVRKQFAKVACKPTDIKSRGCSFSDFLHTDWDKMAIYRLNTHPRGLDLDHRTAMYIQVCEEVFEKLYEKKEKPPQDLIHVTCTGYSSPSAAQKFVSKKKWGQYTQVTHAYHMGCYAAIPAIRIALGYIEQNQSVDIVHTEICSLHTDPLENGIEQIVAQSLFADGFIRYSIGSKRSSMLKIISIHQEIIDGSENSMIWDISPWGFKIQLDKEIPLIIAQNIQRFLKKMAQKASLGMKNFSSCIFAIHPGGPKIIRFIQKILGLKDIQVRFSKEILYNHGNMSSATLPHIWKAILEDRSVCKGTKIISLGFGPGLSVCGCILEKG